MVVSEITLFNLLKTKYGEQEAQTVVEGIKQTVREEFENKKDVLATKPDIASLKEDILKFRIDIEKRFNQLTIWIVATGIALAGIVLGAAKL
jgi:hypothetical protein